MSLLVSSLILAGALDSASNVIRLGHCFGTHPQGETTSTAVHLSKLKNDMQFRRFSLRQLTQSVRSLEQALRERDEAILARETAFKERDEALALQHDRHLEQRDQLETANRDRDKALAALEVQTQLLAQTSARTEDLEKSLRKALLLNESNPNLLDYRDRSFVVILAVGRSGSTLLQGVLNSFPNFLIRGENNLFIAHMYRIYNDLLLAKNKSAAPTTPEHPWFGCEELDAEAFILDCAKVVTRQIIGGRGSCKLDAIGFKEIRWSYSELSGSAPWNFFQFIEHVFPHAKFILLTRDVDQILQSAWWPGVNIPATASQIQSFYFMARNAPVKRLFEIDYIDLKPRTKRLKELVGFLGQTYSERIDQVLQTPHSYDASESNLRERELSHLRAIVEDRKLGSPKGTA